ncbi:unnamed protein product [Rotaria magnacalcarata]|nr:unnamed protein product [Rotaria magnacalcarata]CAF3886530.1 unnamed protein product [Rotaria magnacalcarata]CAF3943157.1 unnamed protein product [Rotaria magnacalcarata]CAF4232439.1 unnamed protein product [Rotaria magnacalcarata]CAF4350256.1 unnamed protein product [Rotaria magnacalcarata]
MQGIIDEAIEKAMTKVSNKLQHRLEVLKNNKVVLNLWKLYKDFYKKEYESAEEEQERIEKFIANLKIIIKENVRFNDGAKSFKLHMNRFGDMDLPEFRKKMTGLNSVGNGFEESVYIKKLSMERQKRFLVDSVKKRIKTMKDKFNKKLHPGKNRTTTTATSVSMVDYRPYMNPIENQGQCGSCYAFAITAAIEGTYALKIGTRIQLSQQQLVDCSPNNGCSGGYFDATFQYIKQSGGLASEKSYPYVGYGTTPNGNEEEMKRALLTYGPLAAGIYVTSDFQFYGPSQRAGTSDIIDIASCPKSVDHAIAIVGYGTENGQDY